MPPILETINQYPMSSTFIGFTDLFSSPIERILPKCFHIDLWIMILGLECQGRILEEEWTGQNSWLGLFRLLQVSHVIQKLWTVIQVIQDSFLDGYFECARGYDGFELTISVCACVLVILIFLFICWDEDRRGMYQFILYTVGLGYMCCDLLVMHNVLFLIMFFIQTPLTIGTFLYNFLFEIPAGLRPNHYHRRFHLSCFGHDIIEYGVTIQVMPDDRQVGHRSLNILGDIFQLPEVHLPPVTAG